MAHITTAQQGLAAVDSRNWDEAVAKLSTAIAASENPAWLIARSKAHAGLKRYPESLQDAELAWHRAFERNQRPLLAEAHYRRALAYNALRQYANADACCLYSMRIVKGHQALEKVDPASEFLDDNGNWTATAAQARAHAQGDEINNSDPAKGLAQLDSGPQAMHWRLASTVRIQVLGEMEKLPKDDPARKWTTGQRPPLKETPVLSKEAGGPASAKKLVPKDTPPEVQDFQSRTAITVLIFSKGVKKDDLEVHFYPTKVVLQPVVYPCGDQREFTLDLWGEIEPDSCSWKVTPNKIELILIKTKDGKWPRLGPDTAATAAGPEPRQAPATSSTSSAGPSAPATATGNHAPHPDKASPAKAPAIPTGQPAYPTSSRTGPKNWDLVVQDEDEDEEPDVNAFFKKLYKGATPEQQRAMKKSFIESNGTTLSTDWDDVKARTVLTSPPKGVEAKKWE
ncbi:Protein SGT1 [Escovopsis weberi]|uniref:Protein SGT1 n=1 Tax=Escovopsis weberi TaxID=150374 RepID=A0A0M8MRT9_ESCWE|nr:Protein SGT1 [Escovopsis weberi]